VKLEAHAISLQLPGGWSGRIFRRAPDLATLHAGDFALALEDGEFGDRSTGRMPPGACFVALTEYRPGTGLTPGAGLFAPRTLPLPLDPTGFGATRLAHPRPGQAGMQHFLTLSGRPLCLYLVVSGVRAERRRQLLALDRVLRSLRVGPWPGRSAQPVS